MLNDDHDMKLKFGGRAGAADERDAYEHRWRLPSPDCTHAQEQRCEACAERFEPATPFELPSCISGLRKLVAAGRWRASVHREPQGDRYLLEPVDDLGDRRISIMVNVERAA